MLYIDKDTDEYVVVCDECDDELELDTGDFDDARAVMREEEWQSIKEGNEWCHYCPDCQ